LYRVAVATESQLSTTPELDNDGVVAVGSSATLSLYTHCGFDQAVIDFAGRLWGSGSASDRSRQPRTDQLR
jgi:hypothetical protein